MYYMPRKKAKKEKEKKKKKWYSVYTYPLLESLSKFRKKR